MEALEIIKTHQPFITIDGIFEKEIITLLNLIAEKKITNLAIPEDIEPQTEQAILFVAYFFAFYEHSPQQSLQEVINLMEPKENPHSRLKSLFHHGKKLQNLLNLTNEKFRELQNEFSFLSLYFASLFKFSKFDVVHSLSEKEMKSIWLIFLLISEKIEEKNLDDRMNLLMTLIFSSIFNDENEWEDLKKFNEISEKHVFYKLDREDYASALKTIKFHFNDFGKIGFDNCLEKLEKEYLSKHGPFDLDFLAFFSSISTHTLCDIAQTPYNKPSFSQKSSHNEFIKVSSQKDELSPNFHTKKYIEATELFQSPNLSQAFPSQHSFGDEKDHAREFGAIIRWFKEQLKTVNLISKSPASPFDVEFTSESFKKYIKTSKIADNLKEALSILHKKAKSNTIKTITFFFSILDRLIFEEVKRIKEDEIELLLNEKNFLNSVVCFALELNFVINNQEKLRRDEILEVCNCGYLDLWKIIYIFNTVFFRKLPSNLAMGIHEIEIEILLKEIWVETPGNKCLAYSIFSSSNANSDYAITTMMKALLSRVYILCKEANSPSSVNEEIWKLIKTLIFYGMDCSDKTHDISFKTNYHLDILVLSSIYHLYFVKEVHFDLNILLKTYLDKIMFPANINYNNLLFYYCNIFKSKIKSLQKSLDLMQEVSRKTLNDTPIQSKIWKRKTKIIETMKLENQNANNRILDFKFPQKSPTSLHENKPSILRKRTSESEIGEQMLFDIAVDNFESSFTKSEEKVFPKITSVSPDLFRSKTEKKFIFSLEQQIDDDLSGTETPNFK